jgi:hypothetical protein
MRFRSMPLTQLFWPRSLNTWSITNKTQVSSFPCFVWDNIAGRTLKWLITRCGRYIIFYSAKNHHPIYIFENTRFRSGGVYANGWCRWKRSVPTNAAADFLGVQPLLELTSLAVLLRYMWVGLYISNFGRNCDKLQLNSSFLTFQLGWIPRGYSNGVQSLTVWWNHYSRNFDHWWI